MLLAALALPLLMFAGRGLRVHLPRMPRPPQPRSPEARARLERFARDYERRKQEHAEAGERLRAERADAIRQAHRDGLPIRDIAAVLKLGHPHVSRIKRSAPLTPSGRQTRSRSLQLPCRACNQARADPLD